MLVRNPQGPTTCLEIFHTSARSPACLAYFFLCLRQDGLRATETRMTRKYPLKATVAPRANVSEPWNARLLSLTLSDMLLCPQFPALLHLWLLEELSRLIP